MKEKKSNRDSGYVPSREMPEKPYNRQRQRKCHHPATTITITTGSTTTVATTRAQDVCDPKYLFSFFVNSFYLRATTYTTGTKKAQTIQMLWALGIFPQVIFIYLFIVIVYV